MTDAEMDIRYSGPLMVIIHSLSGEIEQFTPNYREESSLFEYIGHACACQFTNMSTRLSIITHPDHWKIIKFSSEEQVLEVEQIDGEPLTTEEDDPEFLEYFYSFFGISSSI